MPKELTPHQSKTHNERAGNVYLSGWISEDDVGEFISLTKRAEKARIEVTEQIEANKKARVK